MLNADALLVVDLLEEVCIGSRQRNIGWCGAWIRCSVDVCHGRKYLGMLALSCCHPFQAELPRSSGSGSEPGRLASPCVSNRMTTHDRAKGIVIGSNKNRIPTGQCFEYWRCLAFAILPSWLTNLENRHPEGPSSLRRSATQLPDLLRGLGLEALRPRIPPRLPIQ